MSFDERSEEKSLRGLHRAQSVPIERGDDGSGLIDAFDGIAFSAMTGTAAPVASTAASARSTRAAEARGTGRIMDDDDRRFQFRASASSSARTERWRVWFHPRPAPGILAIRRPRLERPRFLGRIDHRLRRIDRGMQGELRGVHAAEPARRGKRDIAWAAFRPPARHGRRRRQSLPCASSSPLGNQRVNAHPRNVNRAVTSARCIATKCLRSYAID